MCRGLVKSNWGFKNSQVSFRVKNTDHHQNNTINISSILFWGYFSSNNYITKKYYKPPTTNHWRKLFDINLNWQNKYENWPLYIKLILIDKGHTHTHSKYFLFGFFFFFFPSCCKCLLFTSSITLKYAHYPQKFFKFSLCSIYMHSMQKVSIKYSIMTKTFWLHLNVITSGILHSTFNTCFVILCVENAKMRPFKLMIQKAKLLC